MHSHEHRPFQCQRKIRQTKGIVRPNFIICGFNCGQICTKYKFTLSKEAAPSWGKIRYIITNSNHTPTIPYIVLFVLCWTRNLLVDEISQYFFNIHRIEPLFFLQIKFDTDYIKFLFKIEHLKK